MTAILSTYQVSKQFQGKIIISNINMRVKQGEIYGLLGPNGAGKTTILRMITGLIQPTSGVIKIFGEQLSYSSYEIRKRIGSLIGSPIFYEHLSAYENLALHCEYMGFYDHQAIDKALKLTQLTDQKEKPVKQFSLGMKQRLGIARAICTRPELLILDEPINGLDPVGIRDLRELFRSLSKEYGITLLISSHILQEIAHLADTIAVIKTGQLRKEISMAQVRAQQNEYIEAVLTDTKKAAAIMETQMNITNFKVIDEHVIRIYDPDASPLALSENFVLNGVGIASISQNNLSLEDYFLEIIRGEEV